MFRITRCQSRTGAACFGLVPALLAVVLSGVGVQAASPPPSAAAPSSELPSYDTLDANKDGLVTLPEVVVFSPPLAKRIAHCDTNGNKVLTRDEYSACHPKAKSVTKAAAGSAVGSGR